MNYVRELAEAMVIAAVIAAPFIVYFYQMKP